MELAKLSLAELRRLQSKVETEIRRRSDSTRRDLLKRMQKMAAEEGLSLSEIVGSEAAPEKEKRATAKSKPKAGKPAKKSGNTVIKYRHPENPAIGWSGRGRKPQWALDWIAQGKSLDELTATAA